MRFAKMALMMLAAGLLLWGVTGLALAQTQSTPGFTDSSYPSDYYRPPSTTNGIHPNEGGKITLEPMQAPVSDHAASGFHMGEGATSAASSNTPAQNAQDRPMVPLAGD